MHLQLHCNFSTLLRAIFCSYDRAAVDQCCLEFQSLPRPLAAHLLISCITCSENFSRRIITRVGVVKKCLEKISIFQDVFINVQDGILFFQDAFSRHHCFHDTCQFFSLDTGTTLFRLQDAFMGFSISVKR